MLQFGAGIRRSEAPLNGHFLSVASLFPGCDFSLQLVDISSTTLEALVDEDRKLDFDHI